MLGCTVCAFQEAVKNEFFNRLYFLGCRYEFHWWLCLTHLSLRWWLQLLFCLRIRRPTLLLWRVMQRLGEDICKATFSSVLLEVVHDTVHWDELRALLLTSRIWHRQKDLTVNILLSECPRAVYAVWSYLPDRAASRFHSFILLRQMLLSERLLAKRVVDLMVAIQLFQTGGRMWTVSVSQSKLALAAYLGNGRTRIAVHDWF